MGDDTTLEGDLVAIGPGAVALPEGVIVKFPIRQLAPVAHCEGIAVGPDGMLWAGDEAGRLFRIDPSAGGHIEIANVGGWAVGLCVDGNGFVYVCAFDRHAVMRVDPRTGDVDVYCDRVDGGPLPAPNWCLFGQDGTLYVSDSRGPGREEREGRIVAVPPGGGEASALPRPRLHYANGMAMRSDGTLFVLDSFVEPRVLAVRGDTVSVYAELPAVVPDGLAFDDAGGLLVSCFQPNRVLRIPPGPGEPEILVDDWTGQQLLSPTNVAFFGPARKSVAAASLLGWWLSAFDTPWTGQPLFYPDVPVGRRPN